jgi:hypothetical protein
MSASDAWGAPFLKELAYSSEIRNPNLEIRNKFKIQESNVQIQPSFLVLDFPV